MFFNFNRCMMSFILVSVIAFLGGCTAIRDGSVRTAIEPAEQTVEFIDTWEIDKNQIYNSILSWVIHVYGNLDVIDLKDREAGIIVIKSSFLVPVSITYLPCYYSLQIRIKDKKTKMTLHIDRMGGGYPPKNSMASVRSEIKSIHDSYFFGIQNQTKADDF